MKTISLLCFAWPIVGQTLQIQPKAARVGQAGVATIRVDSPKGREPLALQWDIYLREVAIKLRIEDIVIGDAAKAGGKSIACSKVQDVNGKGIMLYRYRCILAGGESPIPNGSVAVLNFSVATDARPMTYFLRVERAFAVDSSVKKVQIRDAAGKLVITR